MRRDCSRTDETLVAFTPTAVAREFRDILAEIGGLSLALVTRVGAVSRLPTTDTR